GGRPRVRRRCRRGSSVRRAVAGLALPAVVGAVEAVAPLVTTTRRAVPGTRAAGRGRALVETDAQRLPGDPGARDAVHGVGVERRGDVHEGERREDVDLADVRPGQAGLVRQGADDAAGHHAVLVPDRQAVAREIGRASGSEGGSQAVDARAATVGPGHYLNARTPNTHP